MMRVGRNVTVRVGERFRSQVDRLVRANTDWLRRVDPTGAQPRDIAHEDWYLRLVEAHESIVAEWLAFTACGGDLPFIDELLGGPQGNERSWWKAGTLIVQGRPSPPLSEYFPRTVEVLLGVPGMLSVMWSVLGPGGELPEHSGPNGGSLRLLVGVDMPEESGHDICGERVDLTSGKAVLFDDTYPHSAWNRSTTPRVLLLGDVLRPLPFGRHARNRTVQFIRHNLTPEYHRATEVGSEWHRVNLE